MLGADSITGSGDFVLSGAAGHIALA